MSRIYIRGEDVSYSVLMSVYIKEKPENLKASISSIFEQTMQTDDFVIVCDGPLTDELNNVIKETQDFHSTIMKIIRLPQNVGLGKALNIGVKHCKNEIIARMDSDDISRPERCEKEFEIINRYNLDIVSATVEEFENNPIKAISKRVVPETQEKILAFAKKRCPFNHPCVMYRKVAVEKAGGYIELYCQEDYFLWVRMLLNGCKGYNIQEPLLWMRAGNGMYKRRSGIRYAKSQVTLFKFMWDKNFISTSQFVTSCIIRICSSLAPNWMRKLAYQMILRK